MPLSPDGGAIADYLGEVADPASVAARLSATPGVVDHGLFGPELVSDVLIARGYGDRAPHHRVAADRPAGISRAQAFVLPGACAC